MALAYSMRVGPRIPTEPKFLFCRVSGEETSVQSFILGEVISEPILIRIPVELIVCTSCDGKGSYVNPKSGTGLMSGDSSEDRIDRYVNEVIIHGSPSTVTDKLKELEETMPLDYLLASILSHETFMRLSNEVMPNLR